MKKKTLLSKAFALILLFSTPLFADSDNKLNKVNVNQATVQQLNESLVGVGPKIAREIVNHRESHGPFESLDDLDQVKYIGTKLLEKNKGRISFD